MSAEDGVTYYVEYQMWLPARGWKPYSVGFDTAKAARTYAAEIKAEAERNPTVTYASIRVEKGR